MMWRDNLMELGSKWLSVGYVNIDLDVIFVIFQVFIFHVYKLFILRYGRFSHPSMNNL